MDHECQKYIYVTDEKRKVKNMALNRTSIIAKVIADIDIINVVKSVIDGGEL